MKKCIVCKETIKDNEGCFEEYKTGKFVHDNDVCYPKVKK